MKTSWRVSVLGFVVSGTRIESFSPKVPRAISTRGFQTASDTANIRGALFASLATDHPANSTSPTTGSDGSSSAGNGGSTRRKRVFSFNQGLNDIADSCSNPGNQVVRLAQKCQTRFEKEKNSPNCVADIVSFNIVLKAWAKAGYNLAESSKHDHMLDKDIAIYTPRDCAQRAMHLLETEDTVSIDVTSINTVMDAWSKSRSQGATDQAEDLLQILRDHDTLEPNSSSYTALIDAYTRSNNKDCMERIEEIWSEVQQQAKRNESPVQLTARLVNALLHAYAKNVYSNKSFTEKSLAILESMKSQKAEESQPDGMTYTTIMDCFSRTGNVRAAEKAGELFDELQALYKKTGNPALQPNIQSYVTLITAWARSRSPQAVENAERILEDMLKEKDIVPSSRALTAVMFAWSRSGSPKQAQRAVQLLQQMKAMGVDNPQMLPTVFSYNTAVDCCVRVDGSSGDQMKALKLAFTIFKSLQSDKRVRPNSGTFSLLLKAVESLLPQGKERNDVATAAFTEARKAGLVNKLVVSSFQVAADRAVVTEVLNTIGNSKGASMVDTNTGYVDYSKIPSSWSQNVPSRERVSSW